MLEAEDADERPVWLEHGTTYVYVKYNNLYLMAVTQRNSNAAMILLFLYRLVEVLKDYFRELEEESIRDNFVITYELLDEMMDFGYPQVCPPPNRRPTVASASARADIPPHVLRSPSLRSSASTSRRRRISSRWSSHLWR